MLNPNEIKQFQIMTKSYDRLRFAPRMRDRLGLTRENIARRKVHIDEYLERISNPQKREAMRAMIYTGCNAKTAALYALNKNATQTEIETMQQYVIDEMRHIENEHQQAKERLRDKIRNRR